MESLQLPVSSRMRMEQKANKSAVRSFALCRIPLFLRASRCFCVSVVATLLVCLHRVTNGT